MKKDFDLQKIKYDEIKIIVFDFEFEREEKESLKQSKEIICPICNELCEINFNNYKIYLNNCINKHCFPNLIINEFYDFQKINEKKIICNQCQSNKLDAYDNKFYICCKCNIHLCPLCKNSHDTKHIIIDYEDKNILCNRRGERYILYCKDNNKSICDLCDMKNNNYIFLYKAFKNIAKLNSINEFQIKINNLKKELKNITNNNELHLVIDNFEKLYKIESNIIKYNNNYKNYYSFINMKNINQYNDNIIKDINKIINEKQVENRLKYIKEIYNKMIINNIITLKYTIEEESFEYKEEGINKLEKFGKIFVEKIKIIFKLLLMAKIIN